MALQNEKQPLNRQWIARELDYQHNGGRTDCLDRHITPDMIYSIQPMLGTSNPDLYEEAEKALAQAKPGQVAIVRANYEIRDRNDITSGRFIDFSKPRYITK